MMGEGEETSMQELDDQKEEEEEEEEEAQQTTHFGEKVDWDEEQLLSIIKTLLDRTNGLATSSKMINGEKVRLSFPSSALVDYCLCNFICQRTPQVSQTNLQKNLILSFFFCD